MAKLSMPPVPGPFDAVFREVADAWRLPFAFLSALAWSETRNKPDATPPASANSSAIGLFQILNKTRENFNKATGASLTRDDMKDPKKCAVVAAWHVRKQIIPEYASTGVAALKEDWSNPFFVGMVFLGYTAGWSKDQGVAYLVPAMLASGFKPSELSAAAVCKFASLKFPDSYIYVDPTKAKPNAKGQKRGPYMSDPVLAKHVNDEVTRYVFVKSKVASEKPPESERNTLAKFVDQHPKVKKAAAAVAVVGVVGFAISMAKGGK